MFSTAAVRAVFVSLIVAVCSWPAHAQPAADATLFRIFLQDGTTLVSYGDYARVADRVVLSVPLNGSASPSDDSADYHSCFDGGLGTDRRIRGVGACRALRDNPRP